jgi:uncharacterized protein YuzE
MKLRYDEEADAAYISFREKGKTKKTIPVGYYIAIDFGSRGNIMGFEVLNASAHIPKDDLRKAILHKVDIPILKLV